MFEVMGKLITGKNGTRTVLKSLRRELVEQWVSLATKDAPLFQLNKIFKEGLCFL